MRRVVLLLMALMTGFSWAGSAAAEELDSVKREDIRHLLEMTGALELGARMSDAVVAQMTHDLRTGRPDIPPELFSVIREEVDGLVDEHLPLFADMMVPLYHRHFTHAEIRELIHFYESGLGQKTIRVMPDLMQESLVIGQRWGQGLGPEIQRRIRERFRAEGIDVAI